MFIMLIMSTYVLFSVDNYVAAQNRRGSVSKNEALNYQDSEQNSGNLNFDGLRGPFNDTIPGDSISKDSLSVNSKIATDSLSANDSIPQKSNSALTDILSGTGKDSLVYDIKTSQVYMYKTGVVNYQDKELNADYINLDIKKNLIIAQGVPVRKEIDSMQMNVDPADSIEYLKPKFVDGATTYDMDSIIYNINSEKAKIYGISFQEGEGTLRGKDIKKMDDEIFNINGGIYTTCDHEHPHFYIKMTKAQFVQNDDAKKVIIGPSYIVLEDVPLPIGVPFGFFPMVSDKNSGVILPEIGEDNAKGFYVKDFGYYFAFNDYMDLTTQAGIYTFGSWEASMSSTYKVRYKFSGSFNFNYAKTITGSKGSSDYAKMNNYSLRWSHSQDSKFLPGSTFSASVNYSTSSYNKYDSDNIQDYISAQTSSSISYSKTWSGTPFSFTSSIQHSQNFQDSSVVLSLPSYSLSMSRIYPFQRKNAVGAQKWYEKISLSYTNTLSNTISTTEDKMFKSEMFDNMKIGMKHSVPVSTSLTFLKYITASPSVSYNERWYFKKIMQEWNPEEAAVEKTDTIPGFYRVYDYSFSTSLTTKLYGMYTFKGKDPAVKAIRHVITPSVSFSYSPDFGNEKYGYYKPVQSNAQGDITYYSPFANEIYGVPSRGESGSISFSLGNTLEMKVRSYADTTGTKIVKLLESFSISSSYNLLADSMNLSNFSVSARTTLFKTLGINVSATFDPYQVDANGTRINKYLVQSGQLARLSSLGFSFGYSFNNTLGADGKGSSNGLNRAPTLAEQDYFARNNISYADQQQYLSMQNYYDFSIPWNLSFNYNFSYSNSGASRSLTQTMSFNGSINLTNKFGLTFSSGLDLSTMEFTPGTVGLSRDLHCWQMTFNWVPVGFRQSWNFKIAVKSGMLSDLKYEKSSSYTNNYSSYY